MYAYININIYIYIYISSCIFPDEMPNTTMKKNVATDTNMTMHHPLDPCDRYRQRNAGIVANQWPFQEPFFLPVDPL